MSGLLPFLSFLLVVAAGGGAEANLAGVAEANSETVAAYWQTALPSSPIPLAVLDLFTPTDNKNENIHKSAMEDPHISGPRKLGKHFPAERKTKKTREDEFLKRPYNYGPHKKEANQNTQKFRSNYGKSEDGGDRNTKEDEFLKRPYNYGPHKKEANQNTQKFRSNYGKSEDGGVRNTKEDEFLKRPYNYGPHKKEANQNTQKFRSNYGKSEDEGVRNTKALPYWYGPHGDGDVQKIKAFPYWYGPHGDGVDQKINAFPYWYGPNRDGDVQKIKAFPYWYGPNRDGDVHKINAFPYWYGPHGDGDVQKIKAFPYWYGSDRDGGDKNIRTYPYIYGPREEEPNQMTHTFPDNYDHVAEADNQKIPTFPYNYGPVGEADDQKIPKFPYYYGPVGEVDDQKIPKFPYYYGPVGEVDDQKIPKFPYYYGPVGEADNLNIPKFPYNYGQRTKFGERQAHVHGHGHAHGNDAVVTGIFFSEDILTQGSLVTPHIQPTTSSSVLLRRDVADSIPFSTKSFAEVVAMFAPASLAMADEIRSTLDVCEHPRPIEGEKITCATSLESLAEFPVSELGTQDVRAFSSDVPREGTASRRYNITALRVLTDSSTKTATCHDMAYPYAVFYCHTVHADTPTRTYMVTLASEDGGDGAPAPTMEALAVCHLDTSKWDPNHPFFVKRHVKPGDTTVCHFLTRGSFLWAPTANTSGGAEQVAAQ